jgi:hypothetical protein
LTVIEAPSFLSGIEALYNNKVTEYPDTINTLQRFNLYPEVRQNGSDESLTLSQFVFITLDSQ